VDIQVSPVTRVTQVNKDSPVSAGLVEEGWARLDILDIQDKLAQ